jgi:hypothetical protein
MTKLFAGNVFLPTRKRPCKRTNSVNPARFSIEPLELRRLLTSLTSVVDDTGFAAEISPLVPAGSARFDFGSASPVLVHAFIDFDGDNAFSEAERVTEAAGFQGAAGISQLVFNVPADAVAQQAAARIDWSFLGEFNQIGIAASNTSSVAIQAAPNGGVGDEVFASSAYIAMPGDSVDGGTLGVNRFASLQQAIDVIAPTGIVTLVDGQFAESITIQKDVTVRGTSQAANVVISPSDSTAHGITIENAANVVIQNLTISGANDAIRANGAGSVAVSNLIASGNSNHGLNVLNAGNVSISNSTFASNDADSDGEGRGVQLLNVGDVVLNNVAAYGNDLGLAVGNAASFNDANGDYSNNTDHGLFLFDVACNVTLSGTNLQNNDTNFDGKGDGLVIEDALATHAVSGDLVLSGVTIGTTSGGNQRDGISVESVGGDVIIGNSTHVSGNNSDGVTIGNVAGAVRISDSQFDGAKGIDRQGSNFFILRATDVYVTDSVFSDAGNKDGLQIETVTATLDISGSTFDGNNRYGFRADRSNVVSLSNNSFQNNGRDGIRMSNNFGGVQITNVAAIGNGGDGLRLSRAGDTSINGGDFSGILVRGANSFSINANSVTGSDLVNSTDRIDVESRNAITLSTNLDADASMVRLYANSDGSGDEGFVMQPDTRLTTASESSSAVSITVNSLLGGTGAANLQRIVAGSVQGTVAIYTNGGAIVDGNAEQDNIDAANGLFHSMGSVGTAENVLNGAVTRLEGAGNGFYFLNTKPLTIGGVDPGFVGVASPVDSIDVRSFGAMIVEEDVIAANRVFLKALETNVLGDDLTVNSGVVVVSVGENVEIRAGDNVTLALGSTIAAVGSITIKGDCADNDPGQGTTITIASHLYSGTGTTAIGGSDDDVYDITYPTDSKHIGGLTVVDAAGIDAVIITGTEFDDTLFVTPTNDDTTVARNATDAETIHVPSVIETLRVNTLDGLDTVTAAPSTTTLLLLDGGSPTFGEPGVPPGDTLKFDPAGHVFTMIDSSFKINGLPDLAFQNFETIELANASPGAGQRFDFNDDLATPTGIGQTPTQDGYMPVAPQTYYTPGNFGWDEPVGRTNSPDQAGLLTDLLRDAHVFIPPSGAQTRTFSATVENGLVLVTVNYGTASNTVSQFQIENRDTDEILVKNLSAYKGNWGHTSFFVDVTDGSLDLRFRAPNGPRRLIAINGLTIEPATLLGMGIAPPTNALPADGKTIDEFAFSGPANTLVTVSSTLGAIKNSDADRFILGQQILTDDKGLATLQVQRSLVEGTSSLTFSLPTGRLLSGVQLEYAIVNARNFDFNTPTSPTFSPFKSNSNPDGYLGVIPDSLFTPSTGFGWTSKSPNAFRLSPSIGGKSASLYDDGHIASDARTFRTLLSNGTYQVSILSGSDIDHEGFSVAANGRNVVDSQKIARREHFETVFNVNVSGGQLDLTFSQNAGAFQNSNWVVNAVSIRPTTLVSPITPVANIGDVSGDGVTISQLLFDTSASNGSLVTVSTTAGTIVTADADPNTAGIQVAVKSNQIQFDLRAANQPGTPTIEFHTVKGDHRATIEDDIFLDFLDAFFSNSGSQTTPFE